MKEKYNKDYFEKGISKGISGYENYRWLPERTLETICEITRRAKINRTDKILDVGCSKGFFVKAFCWLGFDAYGCDISDYAFKHRDEEVKDRIFKNKIYDIKEKTFDIILAKDILEHIQYKEIDVFLEKLHHICRKKIIAVIPLGNNGDRFVIPRHDIDKTHIIKENIIWWVNKFRHAGFKILVANDDVARIKPNWNCVGGNIYLEAIV